ncbi:MAG: prepilin-type N-terminal cleavage/methylation domain-containing protein [Alphaproteobacteria bacterium]|nr:prepilin-type N-terminal cleavage/methylation domain-containing protein [Alphaproteobacteria bacterium]
MKNVNRGFSLIEVAIAVLVISLIATFSLKGKDLIQTAKLRATIDQVESFRVAINSFSDKYGAFPGDLVNAKELIDLSLDNGNGSGQIESIDDVKRFWSHLLKAGLITTEMRNGFPTAKCGGCFSISSNIPGKPGMWIVLTKGTQDNKHFSGVLSAANAHYIDKSIDTGLPEEGDVQVMKAQDASEDVISGSSYNFHNKNDDCVILFKL